VNSSDASAAASTIFSRHLGSAQPIQLDSR
jgi:hypothetical protein